MPFLFFERHFIIKMITLNSFKNYTEFIKNNKASLVYFSTPHCNVCKILKPKIINFIKSEFPNIKLGYVNTIEVKDAAAQNNIFTVPTILFFLEGKEFLRKSRNISIAEFRKELERPYSIFFG